MIIKRWVTKEEFDQIMSGQIIKAKSTNGFRFFPEYVVGKDSNNQVVTTIIPEYKQQIPNGNKKTKLTVFIKMEIDEVWLTPVQEEIVTNNGIIATINKYTCVQYGLSCMTLKAYGMLNEDKSCLTVHNMNDGSIEHYNQ